MKKLPPFFLVRSIQLFRKALLELHDRIFPAGVVLFEKFQNLFLLPPLWVAAQLDIARHLEKGPRKLEELAELTGSDPGALSRILRTLAASGIFRENRNGEFLNTRMSRPLLPGKVSLREVFLQHLGPENWAALGNLLYTVKTGEDAFRNMHGTSIYDYLRQHPEKYEIFDRSMACLSDLATEPLLQRYSFTGCRTIADIGGGDGSMLMGILQRYSGIEGILFDVESALPKTGHLEGRDDLMKRIRTVPGDFFNEIPVKADIYILKNVLHNWNDSQSISILRNIAREMGQSSKLIIIEMVLPERNRFSAAYMIDIQMMATMPGGRERNLDEYRSLLENAGLRLIKIVDTIAPVSIIEAGL